MIDYIKLVIKKKTRPHLSEEMQNKYNEALEKRKKYENKLKALVTYYKKKPKHIYMDSIWGGYCLKRDCNEFENESNKNI